MKKIVVDCFRYEKGGITCCRCGDSTEVVRKVVGEFRSCNTELDIELREHSLGEDRLDLSNTVKINGKDIMDILGEKQRTLTACPSCTDLMGKETDCNTYIYKGKIYDSLPGEMLKEALDREVEVLHEEVAMEKPKVLFVCVHNSARSQMAEAFMNTLCGDRYVAESAGMEPTELNPLVIEVMKEVGIDISRNRAKSVFDFYKQGKLYSFVITVCDETSGQMCPIFPGQSSRLHWSFQDPTKFTGTYEEKLNTTRILRDTIKEKVLEFCTSQSAR